MGTKLFRRTGKLIVGDTSISFGAPEELRVTFGVQKQLIAADPNTASITIDNLAQRTRAKLDQVYKSSKGRLPVLLEAGYVGHHGTIFKGETTEIKSVRGPTGYTTSLTAASGREVARKRINKAFGQDTEIVKILEELLEETVAGTVQGTKEALKSIRDGSIVGAGKALVKGLVMTGDPMRVWDQISKTYNFETLIDDDTLVLVEQGGARKQPAVVLRPDTGLLGSPERVQDDARPGLLLMRCQSLLNPRIMIASAIMLTSDVLSGAFRAEHIEHNGDTHGDDWSTTVEGRSVKLQPVQIVGPPPPPSE